MKKQELERAIQDTKIKIEEVKIDIEKSQDAKEIHRLEKQLKELQVLQLWHLGLLDTYEY